jgi:hypothetical protein
MFELELSSLMQVLTIVSKDHKRQEEEYQNEDNPVVHLHLARHLVPRH